MSGPSRSCLCLEAGQHGHIWYRRGRGVSLAGLAGPPDRWDSSRARLRNTSAPLLDGLVGVAASKSRSVELDDAGQLTGSRASLSVDNSSNDGDGDGDGDGEARLPAAKLAGRAISASRFNLNQISLGLVAALHDRCRGKSLNLPVNTCIHCLLLEQQQQTRLLRQRLNMYTKSAAADSVDESRLRHQPARQTRLRPRVSPKRVSRSTDSLNVDVASRRRLAPLEPVGPTASPSPSPSSSAFAHNRRPASRSPLAVALVRAASATAHWASIAATTSASAYHNLPSNLNGANGDGDGDGTRSQPCLASEASARRRLIDSTAHLCSVSPSFSKCLVVMTSPGGRRLSASTSTSSLNVTSSAAATANPTQDTSDEVNVDYGDDGDVSSCSSLRRPHSLSRTAFVDGIGRRNSSPSPSSSSSFSSSSSSSSSSSFCPSSFSSSSSSSFFPTPSSTRQFLLLRRSRRCRRRRHSRRLGATDHPPQSALSIGMSSTDRGVRGSQTRSQSADDQSVRRSSTRRAKMSPTSPASPGLDGLEPPAQAGPTFRSSGARVLPQLVKPKRHFLHVPSTPETRRGSFSPDEQPTPVASSPAPSEARDKPRAVSLDVTSPVRLTDSTKASSGRQSSVGFDADESTPGWAVRRGHRRKRTNVYPLPFGGDDLSELRRPFSPASVPRFDVETETM
ncbi:unnamed protein product [Protopolystoma xenopodis]|uniref:Uncharacterized protein n=1 Tax=Protopolystoma xenopodis TaxID=117903 RepID=A0A3S5ADM3_9PLAT|nr:unnamed protein product [Protopolystoma xenopodis]